MADIQPFKRVYILKKHGSFCSYCGIELSPEQTTLDHIIPKAGGGVDNIENLVPACRQCNCYSKFDIPLGEWLEDSDRAGAIIEKAHFVARTATSQLLSHQQPIKVNGELHKIWPLEIMFDKAGLVCVVERNAATAADDQRVSDGGSEEQVSETEPKNLSYIDELNLYIKNTESKQSLYPGRIPGASLTSEERNALQVYVRQSITVYHSVGQLPIVAGKSRKQLRLPS